MIQDFKQLVNKLAKEPAVNLIWLTAKMEEGVVIDNPLLSG